ncbi:MAG: sulfatase family protein [Planctomycetota bacterium]|jgi:arylsulfatase A-like enzyme
MIMRLFLLLSLLSTSVCFAADERPNFVIINCDDLGYADIGCFGSKLHRTPNIDRMAAEGIRMTDFYVTSGVCSPSRSSLMTGCYPRRTNLHEDHKGGWVLFPRGKKGLNPDEITIAEVLKSAGYATAIVGKWHLGDQPPFLPTKQGFDSYFGIPYSNDMGWTDRKDKRYPPLPVLRNEEVIEQEPDQRQITQRYTQEVVKFLEANKDQRFFLYLAHTMPHWPQYASEKFAGKSKNGKWGDAVEEIDWSTGVVFDTLKKLGIDKKTLVVFTSDNGGATRWGASNAPLKGAKGSTFEGGQRVCCVVRWPGQIAAGTTSSELAISMDWLPTFAKLAGTTHPQDRIIDGRDIWPLLAGETDAASPHEAFYYYFRRNLECVRSGKWKLRVIKHRQQKPDPIKPFAPQLFDLQADIAEEHDVASQHPQIVKRLLTLADKARTDLGDGDQPGKNQRPAGLVENAKALTDAE